MDIGRFRFSVKNIEPMAFAILAPALAGAGFGLRASAELRSDAAQSGQGSACLQKEYVVKPR